jgi:putative flippase GtrA
MYNLLKEIINYFFVALVATLIDFFVFRFSRDELNICLELANIFGFVVGLIINYFLSNIFVFSKSNNIKKRSEILLVVIISVIGLLINTIIVSIFSRIFLKSQFVINHINYDSNKISESFAKVVAIIITFNWNFFARKIFIYKK